MAGKNDLIRALKIYRERTDDAIAERTRQIGVVREQLAELFRMVNVDISDVGGLDPIGTEEPHAFDGIDGRTRFAQARHGREYRCYQT